jgi:hypothetical protein
MGQQRTWQIGHTVFLAVIVLFLLLITGGVINWPLVTGDPVSRVLTWWVIGAVLLVSLCVIGHGIVGRPLGFLIDDRNRMSLSRLQLVAWTLVVLSGFYTIVLWKIRIGDTNPLNVSIPQELWWLMGISTTSLVGSPLVKSIKKNAPNKAPGDFEKKKGLLVESRNEKFMEAAAKAVPGAVAKATLASGGSTVVVPPTSSEAPIQPAALEARRAMEIKKATAKEAIGADGQEVYFASPDMASPADLFGGEETGNLHVLDMGKVQMFYFTLILVATYAMALLTMLGTNLPSEQLNFPNVNESMVALLGISHAGYLGFKAASHSPSSEPQE